MSPFLEKGRMQPFVHLPIMFWLYTSSQHWSSKALNFLIFRTSEAISSGLASFLFSIFVSTTLSSFWVNCPSLMSSWLLIIFLMGISVTLEEFPSRSLKCCFHKCISSSWQAAFSLALEVLSLLLTSSTVCHNIRDCLSSTKFLILVIRPWMYSICSF